MFLMNFVTSEYTVKAILFSQFFIYFHYIGHEKTIIKIIILQIKEKKG